MSDYGPDWPSLREVAWMRDLYRCLICGSRVEDGHHRRIQGMGGRSRDEFRHNPELLLSVCHPHHMQMHNARALSRDLGYFLRPEQDALTQPVWYQAEGVWCDLLASGVRVYRSDLRAPGERIAA